MVRGQREDWKLGQTCRQPLSQNSRISHAVLSSERELPLRFELPLGLGDTCCEACECTLSCTTLQDTVFLDEADQRLYAFCTH